MPPIPSILPFLGAFSLDDLLVAPRVLLLTARSRARLLLGCGAHEAGREVG